ncbi:MAG: Crp/Fnr family transcriptional regulator [Sulfuricella sp.]|nr:Crp/Fnr family transcriptional regulator [Sulfuricella sp.]
MEDAVKDNLIALFPALQDMSAALWQRFDRDASYIEVPAGTVLFESSGPCQAFPMLLSGSVRVAKAGANGRELQLYRVLPGESCIVTSSCLLGEAAYPARGVAESNLTAVVVPRPLFSLLIEQHSPFRAAIFSLFGERLAELMQLVEEIAFRKLDQRLASLLLAKGEIVNATHQNLADELGSVREIISRLLKSFEDQGLVVLKREQIQVDAVTLRAVAQASLRM